MDTRRKAINIVKLALFTLGKVPKFNAQFDSLIRCAIDDLNTALFREFSNLDTRPYHYEAKIYE